MIERRKGIEKTVCLVLVPVRLRHVVDDRLTILDDVPVTIDNRMAVERHD